jgi:asparagine synthase (glutamine-hydrolysing)
VTGDACGSTNRPEERVIAGEKSNVAEWEQAVGRQVPERALAAIHDPRRVLTRHEQRAVLRSAYGDRTAGTDTTVVAWSGADTPAADQVVDGDVTVPSDWARSWPAALAWLRDARGEFAFVAWDADSRRSLIARDHLGSRPVFYADVGATLYVASEIAPLLSLLPRRPAPDLDVLARRLAGAREAPGATLFGGVRELLPAHALLLDDRGWKLERYWEPRPRQGFENADRGIAASALRDGVEAAVRRRLELHVGTTGALTSGGLDSSIVLACAAATSRAAGRGSPSAWVGVPDRAELDESAFAQAVATQSGCEVVRVPITANPIVPYALEYAERYAVPLEYPAAALFRPLREAAAARGVALVLDGEGGDELFGCEPFLIADQIARGHIIEASRLVRALPGMVPRDARSLGVVLRNWIVPALLPEAALRRVRRELSARRPSPEWLCGPARDAAHEPPVESSRGRGVPHWRTHLAWLLTDARTMLGVQDHLRRVAALDGLRSAHPFLDVDLVELVLGLPPQYAFDPRLDRMLLRTAVRGLLPEQVRMREDKVFFGALLRDSLTGPDRAAIERTLTRTPLALGGLVDADRLAALWHRGPHACARGEAAWMNEIWRAFAIETWLRAEEGARQY